MAVNSYREDEVLKSSDKKKHLLRLLSYLMEYKKKIFLVLICMAVTVAISLANPLIIERALDVYVAAGDVPGLFRLGIFALLLNILYVLMIRARLLVMGEITNKILLTIRQDLYEHIQTLSFAFFDSRPTGKILARIIGDVNALKDVLNNFVTTLIPEFITVIGVVIIMMLKDIRMALASLSTLPFMMIGIFLIQTASHKRWQIFRKKSSNINAYVHEAVAGIQVIQSFGAESETREIFSEVVDEQKNSFWDACRYADMFGPVIDLCWGIGAMMLYLVGIRVLGVENVTVGVLVAFGTYINMFWRPIMNLSNFYNSVVTNLTAAERIFDILDTEAEIQDEKDAFKLKEVKGEIEISNVSFTYNRGTPAQTKVLSKVSFKVRPGETIALVGPTGAGKTTIVNLISRFYDIEEGNIYVDGHDLTKVTLESLRKQMGIMTQDNFIFQGTVRENILYGRPEATEEEMVEAAKAVSAHDFISRMEKGYDTQLKEQGVGLSIGQRQLIAFARTMICKPKILILDEATSSIDTHTELLVQKGIQALLKGRTSFVIAHRLSTIQNADRIFVIDQGGILEQGSPAHLMEKKGAYYRLYMAQFGE